MGAIAWSVLHHLRTLGALCLFATHYHGLADDFRGYPGITMHYMSYIYDESLGGLVFLFQLVPGVSKESYGLNVARLAGIPQPVRQRASQVASLIHQQHDQNRLRSADLVQSILTDKVNLEEMF